MAGSSIISKHSRLEQKQDRDPSRMTAPRAGKQISFRIRDGLGQSRRPARRRPRQQRTSPGEPVYHSRKAHRKSRAGCTNCKKRKVKCDETKPECRKCRTYGISCVYSDLQVKPRKPQPESPAPVTESDDIIETIYTSPPSLPVAYLSARIEQTLRLDSSMEQDVSFGLPSAKSTDTMALHHFVSFTASIMSVSASHSAVAGSGMMRIAFQSPFLMHAVLGAATTHFNGLVPFDQSYKLSESYHWQQAIRLYQKELAKPITPQSMDSLMSTCMLLSISSFPKEEYSPTASWVFSTDPRDLNWLLVQCGLRYLLGYTGKWLNQSIWREPFKEADDEEHTFNDSRPGAVGLHQGLAELCDIDATTTGKTNPYHWPLRMLSSMLTLGPNGQRFARLVTFMGRLSPEYMDLLLQKDHRAMLILAYWLGEMAEEKRWWTYFRAHSECTAICMYLEQHSNDPRILELLEYPASMCGYSLKHRQKDALLQSLILSTSLLR